jgi:hypothetical protein
MMAITIKRKLSVEFTIAVGLALSVGFASTAEFVKG